MTIIKTFDTNGDESKKEKKGLPRRYFVLGGLGIFVLIIIEIWANNTIITYGEKFERLSALAKGLEMENQILENEIAKQASLTNIASKSAKLGFSSEQSIQYIR